MKVYLAGPINGCTDAEASDWRTEAKQWITNCADPMDRDYRGVEDQNITAIVHGDMTDIGKCSAVLANCPRPSYGTAMEIFFAKHTLGKRVVVIVPDDQPVSPWLQYHADVIVHTVADGIRAVFGG